MAKQRWSRREVLKQSGMMGAAGAAAAVTPLVAQAPAKAAPKAAAPALQPGETHPIQAKTYNRHDNLFTKIGLRPFINARGTITMLSGSTSLPEVKQAMYDASQYYVQLDELQEAVSKELGQLTGAEWGISCTGSAAATCLATVACIAGTDIEKCEVLPFQKKKDQVLIPATSRNPYDIGVRMSGTELVEFTSVDDMKSKISDRVAMLYILAGPNSTGGALATSIIAPIAKAHGIPVFVDAAAEEPNKPNIHLAAGADLVAYSGGKCMRGPQSAGLMIGNKNLCQAAFYQGGPHHCYGRALKCSKEETMGLLAAVRAWYTRDHAAETKMWTEWMQHIADRLKGIPSLEATVSAPHEDLSNKCPGVSVRWDAKVVGITGTELAARLSANDPRIILTGTGTRPDAMASGFRVSSYMLNHGEAELIANEVYKILKNPGHYENPVVPSGADHIEGNWSVTIHYLRGTGEQRFALKQSNNAVTGEQHGEYFNTTFTSGKIHGNQIELISTLPVRAWPVHCTFIGTVQGNQMSGKLNMGEYGIVDWDAVRV